VHATFATSATVMTLETQDEPPARVPISLQMLTRLEETLGLATVAALVSPVPVWLSVPCGVLLLITRLHRRRATQQLFRRVSRLAAEQALLKGRLHPLSSSLRHYQRVLLPLVHGQVSFSRKAKRRLALAERLARRCVDLLELSASAELAQRHPPASPWSTAALVPMQAPLALSRRARRLRLATRRL
jgi:hypothetical protein